MPDGRLIADIPLEFDDPPSSLEPARVVLSPDERYAYVITGTDAVATIDTKSNKVIKLIPISFHDVGHVRYMKISPDGNRLVFGDTVWVYNLQSDTAVQLINNFRMDIEMCPGRANIWALWGTPSTVYDDKYQILAHSFVID